MLAFVLSAPLFPAAFAEQVVDLYQAEPLVTTQNTAERNEATKEAMAEVLVRASGQPQVLEDPGVVSALSRASNYLQQYSYGPRDQMMEVDGEQVSARKLHLQFSASAIEKLLRDLQLPIWPANRPTMLVWLVADAVGQGRQLVSPQNRPELIENLKQAAKQRGLPLTLPLFDLEDQVALSANQLWSLDESAIAEASQRYQPDSILVGRLSETSRGEWRADWYLMHRGRGQVFDGSSMEVEQLAAQGVGEAADYFFGLYGIVPKQGPLEALAFQVNGIDEFGGYTQVLEYLERLAVVRKAELVAVRGDSMLLYLYPEGDLTLLRDALALDNKLVPEPGFDATAYALGSGENPLRYRWR